MQSYGLSRCIRLSNGFEYLQRVAGFLQSGSDTGLALDQCDEVCDFLSVQVEGLKCAGDCLSRQCRLSHHGTTERCRSIFYLRELATTLPT